ncbi:MAG: glycosyltransferase [Oscillospiraceae bacterium]|jgi:hypothetical protein|nr:glycosyltransferase [Oscillospiraceae bacterium]
MPKVSVIIPVYNTETYLPACLDSLLSQTFSDWECLLVNDCSPDGSAAVLDAYAAKDSRFRVLTRAENGGLSAARNTGLAEASGDYIFFFDSDDTIGPDLLRDAAAAAEAHGADIVSFGFRFVYPDGRTEDVLPELPAPFVGFSGLGADEKRVRYGFQLMHNHLWSRLFRRELFFVCDYHTPDARIVGREDRCLLPALTAAASGVAVLPTVYYNYIQREGSLVGKLRGIPTLPKKAAAGEATRAMLRRIGFPLCYADVSLFLDLHAAMQGGTEAWEEELRSLRREYPSYNALLLRLILGSGFRRYCAAKAFPQRTALVWKICAVLLLCGVYSIAARLY